MYFSIIKIFFPIYRLLLLVTTTKKEKENKKAEKKVFLFGKKQTKQTNNKQKKRKQFMSGKKRRFENKKNDDDEQDQKHHEKKYQYQPVWYMTHGGDKKREEEKWDWISWYLRPDLHAKERTQNKEVQDLRMWFERSNAMVSGHALLWWEVQHAPQFIINPFHPPSFLELFPTSTEENDTGAGFPGYDKATIYFTDWIKKHGWVETTIEQYNNSDDYSQVQKQRLQFVTQTEVIKHIFTYQPTRTCSSSQSTFNVPILRAHKHHTIIIHQQSRSRCTQLKKNVPRLYRFHFPCASQHSYPFPYNSCSSIYCYTTGRLCPIERDTNDKLRLLLHQSVIDEYITCDTGNNLVFYQKEMKLLGKKVNWHFRNREEMPNASLLYQFTDKGGVLELATSLLDEDTFRLNYRKMGNKTPGFSHNMFISNNHFPHLEHSSPFPMQMCEAPNFINADIHTKQYIWAPSILINADGCAETKCPSVFARDPDYIHLHTYTTNCTTSNCNSVCTNNSYSTHHGSSNSSSSSSSSSSSNSSSSSSMQRCSSNTQSGSNKCTGFGGGGMSLTHDTCTGKYECSSNHSNVTITTKKTTITNTPITLIKTTRKNDLYKKTMEKTTTDYLHITAVIEKLLGAVHHNNHLLIVIMDYLPFDTQCKLLWPLFTAHYSGIKLSTVEKKLVDWWTLDRMNDSLKRSWAVHDQKLSYLHSNQHYPGTYGLDMLIVMGTLALGESILFSSSSSSSNVSSESSSSFSNVSSESSSSSSSSSKPASLTESSSSFSSSSSSTKSVSSNLSQIGSVKRWFCDMMNDENKNNKNQPSKLVVTPFIISQLANDELVIPVSLIQENDPIVTSFIDTFPNIHSRIYVDFEHSFARLPLTNYKAGQFLAKLYSL